MATVKVLTIREAASRLDRRPETIQRMLFRDELTPAEINGRLAVLEDAVYRRQLKARTVAA